MRPGTEDRKVSQGHQHSYYILDLRANSVGLGISTVHHAAHKAEAQATPHSGRGQKDSQQSVKERPAGCRRYGSTCLSLWAKRER